MKFNNFMITVKFLIMWRIKCINTGKYVKKTGYGNWLEYTKAGKIFTSHNLALKNLELCRKFTREANESKYKDLRFKLEKI